MSRPLSAASTKRAESARRRPESQSSARGARPRTAGGSRYADEDATCTEVGGRWVAAAESIEIFSDHSLAQAAVDNIVNKGGRWVSEGFKCWMEDCVARRAALDVSASLLYWPKRAPSSLFDTQ